MPRPREAGRLRRGFGVQDGLLEVLVGSDLVEPLRFAGGLRRERVPLEELAGDDPAADVAGHELSRLRDADRESLGGGDHAHAAMLRDVHPE